MEYKIKFLALSCQTQHEISSYELILSMKMDVHLQTGINLHLHITFTVKFSLNLSTSVIKLKNNFRLYHLIS